MTVRSIHARTSSRPANPQRSHPLLKEMKRHGLVLKHYGGWFSGYRDLKRSEVHHWLQNPEPTYLATQSDSIEPFEIHSVEELTRFIQYWDGIDEEVRA